MVDVILDPTGGQRAASAGTAVRTRERARLEGATVGLLSNTKQNAALFLDELGKLLVDRYGVAAVKPMVKKTFALPVPDDQLAELKESCDAVITGVGDCGSCSASAVADGVAFERNGVPAAVICSDAFVVTADAMAELRDAKGYHYAKTAHPVAILTPDEVRKRAEEVVGEVVSILTDAS
ncbi:UGSC family (seleno)protein [Amycolatopsis alkalitolerans]|uniref:UGSC-like domain-containing protein n=1 Tax=Amycolatopsis alkalitolerans TaxID=2547244 RepID=A0A5C4LPA5_9PSEU|nr:UGSC family (seleno)protein [Amycolatopsis alkalitolerans]TNC18849.1 hypothetical protein FG385_33330 [Amycolatopsis alkalitolerans]